MEAFTDMFGDLLSKLPENGGCLVVNNNKTIFINTCSIDYFLVVCYIISRRLLTHLKLNKKTFFDNFLIDSYNYITVDNNFNLVRNAWLNYNKGIVSQRKEDNVYVFNCLSDEFASYYSSYSKFQKFQWNSTCPNEACIANKNTKCESNAFILM
jgi:hypothetical protein